jgi:2-methylfumaryl-CoA isomerase
MYPGRPFIMGESPRPPARRAPLLGEHTAEVLCGELGIDPTDLPRLREQGVI